MKRINITMEFEVDQSINDELLLNGLPLAIRNAVEPQLPNTVVLQRVVADVMGNNYWIIPFLGNDSRQYHPHELVTIVSETKPTFYQMLQAIVRQHNDSGDILRDYQVDSIVQLMEQSYGGGIILTDKGRQLLPYLPQKYTTSDVFEILKIDTIIKG